MSDKHNLSSQTNLNFNRIAYRVQREIPVDSAELERLIDSKFFAGWADEEEKVAYYEKRRLLIEQLFTAASKILTEIQYQIFSAYFIVGMSEAQIADSFRITQPYVSIVLSACCKKIKKHLRLK